MGGPRGPGGVPGGARGGPPPLPGGVVDELRLLHPHLRAISRYFKNGRIETTWRNACSLSGNEDFWIISRILSDFGKKDRNNKVSIDELKKSPRRSCVFSFKKRLCFWRDHFFRENAAFRRYDCRRSLTRLNPSIPDFRSCPFVNSEFSIDKFL